MKINNLIADLLMLDYKTKLKIIKEYIKKFEIDFDNEILSRVAKNDNFNIRKLEGIINKLVAVSYLSNKSICLEEFDEIIDDIYIHLRLLHKIMDINNTRFLKILRKYLYRSYQKYADKVSEKRSKGQWMDTWEMIVNPNNDNRGFAFTLVGCPLVEYAKKYGYMELMPHMCALDHTYAKLMHAKLIRTHTVATGADSCDYWYVPDKSKTAREYRGVIV